MFCAGSPFLLKHQSHLQLDLRTTADCMFGLPFMVVYVPTFYYSDRSPAPMAVSDRLLRLPMLFLDLPHGARNPTGASEPGRVELPLAMLTSDKSAFVQVVLPRRPCKG